MIPKIVHYCWLSGDKFPEKIDYCIQSWNKYLKDYEIRLWDLNRFDISKSPWCKEAFEAKKYAFAADYIRCYALFNYGGIYLDSDVEVLKSFDDILDLPYFIGKEMVAKYEPAIMGAEKGWAPLKKMLDYYDNRHFLLGDNKYDLLPMPEIMKKLLDSELEYNLITNKSQFDYNSHIISVFESDFFSPKQANSNFINITSNTYTVHHFEASWFPADKKAYRIINKFFGGKIASFASFIYHKIKI